MTNYLVLSSSLRAESNSRILARAAVQMLKDADESVEFVDLQDVDLPMCGSAGYREHPEVLRMKESVGRAQVLLVATPIYVYDVSGVLKNFLDCTGHEWEDKLVGFMMAAGGQGSYMSIMSFANSLMLDFRCFIIPHYTYATGAAFENGRISNEEIAGRLQELVSESRRLSKVVLAS